MESSDETPFYILGIALACWALLISALGVKLESFPRSGSTAIALAVTTIVLVTATIFAAIYVSI